MINSQNKQHRPVCDKLVLASLLQDLGGAGAELDALESKVNLLAARFGMPGALMFKLKSIQSLVVRLNKNSLDELLASRDVESITANCIIRLDPIEADTQLELANASSVPVGKPRSHWGNGWGASRGQFFKSHLGLLLGS